MGGVVLRDDRARDVDADECGTGADASEREEQGGIPAADVHRAREVDLAREREDEAAAMERRGRVPDHVAPARPPLAVVGHALRSARQVQLLPVRWLNATSRRSVAESQP